MESQLEAETKLSVEKILDIQEDQNYIRNLSIIAHVDHGKSTLSDSLVSYAGLMKQDKVGKTCYTDTLEQEAKRGVTIKSTSISLVHKDHLINLIDSPGHIDFSSEVTAALRVTDGAMIVVDVIEGFRSQSRTVTLQALQERIKPILMINKIDRMILEQGKTPEELYQRFAEIIDTTNSMIELHGEQESDVDIKIDPVKGNVAFGSARDGFVFSLDSFVDYYKGIFPKLKRKKFTKRLWGEYFWDPSKNNVVKYSLHPETKETLDRTFVHFILKPIYKIYHYFSELTNPVEKEDEIMKMIKDDFHLSSMISLGDVKDKISVPKECRDHILQNLHPAAVCLLEMIIKHLPSPVVAQKYRTENIYTGPMNDEYATAMKNCDKDGPLMIFISKSVEVGKLKVLLGRVFSGTIKSGQKVILIHTKTGEISEAKIGEEEEGEEEEEEEGEEGEVESKKKKNEEIRRSRRVKKKLPVEAIQSVNVMLARSSLNIPHAYAGMVVGLAGKIAKKVPKTATLTDGKGPGPHVYPFKQLQFKVSAVISRGISVRARKHEKVLRQAIERLTKTDPLLEFRVDQKTGQMLLTGSGEFHLVTSLELLREVFCPPNVKIETSPPIVTFRETCVEERPGEKGLAKTSDKLNRIYLTLELLDETLVSDLESGKIKPGRKGFVKAMAKYGMSSREVKKILAFGPEGRNTNMLVDQTRGVAYFNEVKSAVVSGFQTVCHNSAVCEEELRGVRINIVDGKFHSDPTHRSSGSIRGCMSKVMKGMILASGPRLVEPWYYLEIQTKQDYYGPISSVLNKRRARISSMENTVVQSLIIRCHLPVLESLGVVDELRRCTSGNALSTMIFSHWEVLEKDRDIINDETSKTFKLIREVRKRKKMHNVDLPNADDYLDKL